LTDDHDMSMANRPLDLTLLELIHSKDNAYESY
jgi:hypothetical protein